MTGWQPVLRANSPVIVHAILTAFLATRPKLTRDPRAREVSDRESRYTTTLSIDPHFSKEAEQYRKFLVLDAEAAEFNPVN